MKRAFNLLGPFSEPVCFYKEYPAPNVTAPRNGAVVPGVPTFVWEPVNGAASYRLQLSRDPNFNLAKTYETDNTRFTPTDELKPGRWYWRVQIRDAERQWGPYTQGTIVIGHKILVPYLVRSSP